MPAQKRSNETLSEDEDDVELQRNNQNISKESEEEEDVEQEERESDDDGSPSSSCSDKDEFVFVKLAEVRKEVQCPICLGIIRKTRKVMECLHRFCRECIDKSMRLGNNECPACRAHCASRRSLRDDPNYDALIAILYPDIDKYEAEELAFHEEEKARNKQENAANFLARDLNPRGNNLCVVRPKRSTYYGEWCFKDAYLGSFETPKVCNVIQLKQQIQASIDQTSRRQLEALGKKRASAKATVTAYVRRSQGNTRNLRERRSRKSAESQGSDNEEDADNDNGGKYSSSADEPCTEVRPKRYKRWAGAHSLQSSLPSGGVNGRCDNNETETTRKMVGVSAGLVGSSEILAWGRGGMRSHTRHGSQSSSTSKSSRNNQLAKLIDHLQRLPQNDDKLDIHIKLVSLDEQKIPNLQNLHLCCSPAMSTTYVCQYVARENGLHADEIELLLVKGGRAERNPAASLTVPASEQPEPVATNPSTDEWQLLEEHLTLSDLTKTYIQNDLTIAYRKKLSCS